MKPLSVSDKLSRLADSHAKGMKIASLTAYDYPTARLIDESGIDLVLVGDSLGMMVYGFQDTIDVTMQMMENHTLACARGVSNALLVSDLPYHSYETKSQALANARRLVEAGAEAVKLEGGANQVDHIKAIVQDNIPFLGHIGMLPQHVREEGGYKKKGRNSAEKRQLHEDALALEETGAFAMVLEGIIPAVAAEITAAVNIPTIGIGSGHHCDGQVLVINDLLGSFPWFRPPFATPRASLAEDTLQAVSAYISDLRED
ncbi:MAG: 3-methyl-2-oxobutanoate hydroxymethyltransferase [Verrucomicrobiota bacterium]